MVLVYDSLMLLKIIMVTKLYVLFYGIVFSKASCVIGYGDIHNTTDKRGTLDSRNSEV